MITALVVEFPYLIFYIFFMDAWSLQMDLIPVHMQCEQYLFNAFNVLFSSLFGVYDFLSSKFKSYIYCMFQQK